MAAFDAMRSLVFLKRLLTSFSEAGNYFYQIKKVKAGIQITTTAFRTHLPMNEEKISIIMAAYNTGMYIGEAIQSVIDQSYTNWELLIIDDGSTDDTESVVSSFQDNRIRFFSQPNAGVSVARNQGLKNMTGNYFCFLDADDLMTEKSLASRLSVFHQNPEVMFVDGKVFVKNENLNHLIRTYQPCFTGFPLKKLIRLSHDCFLAPTWMVRRQPGFNYQFKEGLTHGEDRLFFIGIANQGKYAYTESPVLIYRRRQGSAMSNLKGLQKGYENLYKTVKNKVPGRSVGDLLFLKYKIMRIMFLSNISAGKPGPAIATLFRNIFL